jgi:hypothetical protein
VWSYGGIELAQDRKRWQELVNAVMNSCSIKCEEFLE